MPSDCHEKTSVSDNQPSTAKADNEEAVAGTCKGHALGDPLDPVLGLKLIPEPLKDRLAGEGLSIREYLDALGTPPDARLPFLERLQNSWAYVIDEDLWYAESAGEELKRSSKGMQAAYSKTIPQLTSNATSAERELYRALKKATGVSDIALEHPRTVIVESTAAVPGKKTLVWDRDRFCFNRWRPGWLRPTSKLEYRHEIVQLWLDVIYAICAHESNGDLIFDYLLNWMAVKVQRRDHKMPTAPYITGASGIGKTSIVFEPLVQILGEHNAAILIAHDMDSRFTAPWAHMELVVVDEAEAGFQSFEKGTGRSAKGKQAITDRRIKKEGKGVEATFIANRTSWCFCSNYKTGVLIEDQNRRYMVIGCPKLTEDHQARIQRYWQCLNGDSDPRTNPRAKTVYENIYRFLLERNLDSFNPRLLPESAAALEAAQTMKPAFWQLLDRLHDEQEEPFERSVVSISEIRIALAAHHYERVSDGEIRAWLESKQAINHSQALKENGKPFGGVLCWGWSSDPAQKAIWKHKQFRMWVVRDQEDYLALDEDGARSGWVLERSSSAGHDSRKDPLWEKGHSEPA